MQAQRYSCTDRILPRHEGRRVVVPQTEIWELPLGTG